MILYCFIWKDIPKKDLQSLPYSLRTVSYHILSYEKDSIESPFIVKRLGLSYTRLTYTLDKVDPQKQEQFRKTLKNCRKGTLPQSCLKMNPWSAIIRLLWKHSFPKETEDHTNIRKTWRCKTGWLSGLWNRTCICGGRQEIRCRCIPAVSEKRAFPVSKQKDCHNSW